MTPDLLQILLPALLALAGTVFGVWLGHRRWASEFNQKKRQAFDASRYRAYEELWKVLENAHITIRTGRPEPEKVSELDQQINEFRLRNSVLLEKEDMQLSNDYFNSIVKLAEIIAESGSRELEERFAHTNMFGEGEIGELAALNEANEHAEELRNRLIERVRSIMLETSYAVTPG